MTDQDSEAYAKAMSRPWQMKFAMGSTLAAIAMLGLLPWAVAEHRFALVIPGVIFALLSLPTAYLAFCSWWYLDHGQLFQPPAWLNRFGRALDRALNTKIGP